MKRMMNRSIAVLVVAGASAVSGCGVESASTAATAAALKQKELEAGRKTMSEAERKIGQSMEQVQRNAEKTDEAGK